MAEFLTTTDTSASIERIIRGADKKLMLISAYVIPRMIYMSRLKDAAARGVEITLIFGKRRMDDKVMALFKELDNLEIYYLDILHAKCFVNEKEAVVTSLNLLNGSEEKNREMGVSLSATEDQKAYLDCVNEIRSILATAELIFTSPRTITPTLVYRRKPSDAPKELVQHNTAHYIPFPKNGVCLRCKTKLPCNPDSPLCGADFKIWVQTANPKYKENFCHTCGKLRRVSMAKPICRTCLRVYASALIAWDDARKEKVKKQGPLISRSWRVS